MKKVAFLGTVVALLLSMAAPAVVMADQSYHTERLPLTLTAAGEAAGHTLRNGMVVNSHPNGPVNGAIETYVLVGATPNTEYAISWVVEGVGTVPTGVVVSTDKQGNGRAQMHIPRQWQIDMGLTNLDLRIMWVFVSSGVDVYVTDWTDVHID